MNIKALFNAIFGKQTSGVVAKERLRLVLIHDRSQISPELIGIIKEEIIQVLTKHMEIDEAASQVNLHESDGTVVLEANLAVKSIKRGRIEVNA